MILGAGTLKEWYCFRNFNTKSLLRKLMCRLLMICKELESRRRLGVGLVADVARANLRLRR